MKVLILTNLYAPYTRGGGAERVAELQTRLFSDAGHDVTVLSTRPDDHLPETVVSDRVRVVRFRPRNLYHLMHADRHIFPKRLLWHVKDTTDDYPKVVAGAAIDQMHPDVVLTHNMKGFGLSAFRAIAESGTPHIHCLHDIQLVVPSGLKMYGREHSPMASGVFQKAYVRMVKRQVGSPTRVISPTRFLLEEHEQARLFPESVRAVMPNPSPWDVLPTARVLPSDRPFFVYAGQLEPHKGLHELMDALSVDIDADFAIIGAGSMERRIKVFVSSFPRTKFRGYLSPTKVRECVMEATAVLMPSRCYENAPNIILEALSVGTPVIASRIGGIPELVGEEDGILVPPGDARALRAAIDEMVGNRRAWIARREGIAERAKRFSVDVYKERLFSIVNEIVRK